MIAPPSAPQLIKPENTIAEYKVSAKNSVIAIPKEFSNLANGTILQGKVSKPNSEQFSIETQLGKLVLSLSSVKLAPQDTVKITITHLADGSIALQISTSNADKTLAAEPGPLEVDTSIMIKFCEPQGSDISDKPLNSPKSLSEAVLLTKQSPETFTAISLGVNKANWQSIFSHPLLAEKPLSNKAPIQESGSDRQYSCTFKTISSSEISQQLKNTDFFVASDSSLYIKGHYSIHNKYNTALIRTLLGYFHCPSAPATLGHTQQSTVFLQLLDITTQETEASGKTITTFDLVELIKNAETQIKKTSFPTLLAHQVLPAIVSNNAQPISKTNFISAFITLFALIYNTQRNDQSEGSALPSKTSTESPSLTSAKQLFYQLLDPERQNAEMLQALGTLYKQTTKGEWQVFILPLYYPDSPEMCKIYVHDESRSENNSAPERHKHFLVELNTKAFGTVVIDGLFLKEEAKQKLELSILLSERSLLEPLQEEMRAIFLQQCDLLNITGHIKFSIADCDNKNTIFSEIKKSTLYNEMDDINI